MLETESKAVYIGFCPTYTENAGLRTLKGTEASIDRLLAALVARCKFTSRGVLSGASVTADCIRESVTKLASELPSDALVVINFCGHGVDFGGAHCLVADDGTIVPVQLLASIVAKQVLERKLSNVQLVLVLDCCRGDAPSLDREIRVLWAYHSTRV